MGSFGHEMASEMNTWSNKVDTVDPALVEKDLEFVFPLSKKLVC